MPFILVKLIGAGGRNRTDTRLPSQDFESCASTNFPTPALYMFSIISPEIYHTLNSIGKIFRGKVAGFFIRVTSLLEIKFLHFISGKERLISLFPEHLFGLDLLLKIWKNKENFLLNFLNDKNVKFPDS